MVFLVSWCFRSFVFQGWLCTWKIYRGYLTLEIDLIWAMKITLSCLGYIGDYNCPVGDHDAPSNFTDSPRKCPKKGGFFDTYETATKSCWLEPKRNGMVTCRIGEPGTPRCQGKALQTLGLKVLARGLVTFLCPNIWFMVAGKPTHRVFSGASGFEMENTEYLHLK